MRRFRMNRRNAMRGTLAASLLLGTSALWAQGGYRLLRRVPLGAAEGGREYFDYIAFDAGSRRVFVSRGTEFQVLNADTDAVLGTVKGLKRDHGVAVVADLGRGYITDGDAGEVVVFDLKTFRVTARIKADQDADSILYDTVSKRIFTFNGDPGNSTVIDPVKGTVVATLKLGGKPEQAVADGNGMIYANLEDKSEVVAIDSRTLKITARWPVAPAAHPVSIAMDRQTRRLFIGSRGPAMMVMMDAVSGRIIGPGFPIGGRVDTNVFDPATKLAACSTGDGTIHIFHEDSPEKLSEVRTVKTEYGAKTMALDPKTHNLIVDTADFEERQVPGKKGPQRAARPGTLHLLVYGR